MRLLIAVLISVWLVAGCATTRSEGMDKPSGDLEGITCNSQNQPEEQVQLDRVDGLMARDYNHAALAQLEARPLSSVNHWVRYGQLKVSTGQLEEAENIFRALVEECNTGRSHHGLGMVLLKKDQVVPALEQLKIARRMSPASGQVRNDYGYVLLMMGDYLEAAYELRTSMELGDGQGPVRQNLAVAYLLTENWAGLQWMTQEYGFTGEERDYAERLAATFRSVQ